MLWVRTPPGWAEERRYAVGVLIGEFLGLEHRVEQDDRTDVEITLGGDAYGRRLQVRDDLFSRGEEQRLTPLVLPSLPLDIWNVSTLQGDVPLVSADLPVVYGLRSGKGFIDMQSDRGRLEVDVFGSAFFFLTRLEESIVAERDEHGRFPSRLSLASQAGLLDRPIVDEYAEILWWAINRLWPQLERRGRSFRFLPSHDVDWPTSRGIGLGTTLRGAAADIVIRREPSLAGRRLASSAMSRMRLKHADVYDTFDLIMESSEAAGLRSAFYFIAQESPAGRGGTYSIDDPWIRKLLRRISERGHEVGLHPSYESFDDSGLIRAEAERFLRACSEEGVHQESWGGRQHYLRFRNPDTWQGWEDAQLDYDSTLGFSDRIGFRCGTCREYPTFNIETRLPLRLRERPLIAMEMAAFGRDPKSLEAGVAEVRRLIEQCRLFGGDFTLLWHNSRLLSREERRAYTEVLR